MECGLLAVLAHRWWCGGHLEHLVGTQATIQTAELLFLPHFVIEVVAEQFSRTGAGTEAFGFRRRLVGKRIGRGRVQVSGGQRIVVSHRRKRWLVRGKVEGLDFRLQLQHGVQFDQLTSIRQKHFT